MALTILITDAGRAALINADKSGTRAVRVANVGVSPTATVPTATATALPGEIKRIATISGAQTAADTIHLTVQDESAAVYTVRSFGLYLDDGTLFAIYGQADVIVEKSAQALLLLAIDVTLQDVAATSITFGNANFLLPAATTERQGLVELATDAEAAAMVDAVRALTPRGAAMILTAANILSRLLTIDGAGSGLDADLLDGRDGSYYADILARLGYTPLNATAYTAADVKAKLLTVDGAGSGVDADLLDGRQGSEFALLSGATFTGNVDARDITVSRGDNTGVIYLNGSRTRYLYYGANGYELAGSGLIIAGATAWTAGNDGAGSGLDADLVRGRIIPQGAWLGQSGITISNVDPDSLQVGASAFITHSSLPYESAWYVAALEGGDVADRGLLLASPYQTGDLYLRSRPAGWTKLWSTTNDGAGSGLDADLLDGRQAAEFALLSGARFTGDVYLSGATFTGDIYARDITVNRGDGTGVIYLNGARTRYLYFGANGYELAGSGLIVAGAIAWTAGNDGAGSGMDADLLDGRQGSEFALLTGATFTGNVNVVDITASRGNGTGVIYLNGANTRYLHFDGASYHLPGAGLNVAGASVWTAGNDGAGSGLDSDMVDGWQADELRRWGNLLDRPGSFPPSAHGHSAADIAGAFANASLAANGYQVLPNGLILQWVTGSYQSPGTEAAIFVNWPIAFPNACFQAFPSTQIQSATDRGDSWFQLAGDPSVNGCTVMRQRSGNPNDSAATAPKIFAIGN